MVGSATLVAMTLIGENKIEGSSTSWGAVNNPVAEIVLIGGSKAHMTDLSLDGPATVIINCKVLPIGVDPTRGKTETCVSRGEPESAFRDGSAPPSSIPSQIALEIISP